MHLVSLLGVLFTTPLAAAAVAGGAAAVPIIIHLLNRKRYVVINWAAMRFLLAAQKKNVRRLKLEQWLLLAIRTLLVLLLVLAMVSVMRWIEPLWQRIFPGDALAAPTHGRTHHIIVIDGSFTMATRRGDDQSRFDAAKAQARAILEKSSPGDGYSLILMGSPAQVIVPGPADDRDKVARELDDLKLPHGSADVAGAMHAAAEIASKSKALNKHPRRAVYFISDLRRSAWTLPVPVAKDGDDGPSVGASAISDSWARLLDGSMVVAIDIAEGDTDNIAVTSLSINDPMPLIHTDLSLSATLHNHGRQAHEDLPVSLLLHRPGDRGAPAELGTQLVNIPPHGSLTVNFALERQNRFREPGQYVLQVKAGGDNLRLDDTRSLALTVRNMIPVVVVNGKPSPDPLDRASGFLTRALNPFPEGERSPESPADVRVLNTREFQDAGLGDLFRPESPVEVVFLCDLPIVGGNEAARLDAHLKRGGSVVIGLGPNAANNIDAYNRVLYNDGNGLLPGPLQGVRRVGDGQYFTLHADEEAFQRPPLSGFKSEKERASFATPHFGRYLRMDLPPTGPARRIFSYLPSDRNGKIDRLDPAVVEWPRHRGRVIVFTSSLNADWTEWPRTLSFAPFVQELLRFAVSSATRQTIQVGEPLEEYVPANFVDLTASIAHESGAVLESIKVKSQDEAGLIRLSATDRMGVHRVSVGGHESLFAVNVPVLSLTGGAESDLRRLTAGDFASAVPDGDVQVVNDAGEVRYRAVAGTAANGDVLPAEPRGPAVARILLIALVGLLLLESILALRFGSARVGEAADPMRVRPARWLTPLWVVPLLACAIVFGVITHAIMTGEFLGFLPASMRHSVEQSVGVPEAAPGEGTRWRLESMAYMTSDTASDRWLVAGLLIVAALFVWQIYRRERPGPNATGKLPGARNPLVRLGTIRFGLLLLAIAVLLPQVKLVFEREGWPDVVVAIDDSRSMGVVDTFRDPEIRARADELKAKWDRLAAPRINKLQERSNELRQLISREPSSGDTTKLKDELAQVEARVQDLRTPHRLNLIKAMLATGDGDWLRALLNRRQMRVHVYRVSGQSTQMADLDNADQCQQLLDNLMDVMPSGESSQLGNGVTSILKTFRGGSLNAIVFFTDGVTTRGEEISSSARSAARAGVPLHLVGLGDSAEPPDLILSDLRAEEVVHVNDRLVIEARVSAKGPGMPDSVPVTLSEIRNGEPVELAREVVRLDPQGKPVKVRFVHQPKVAGESTLVIQFPKEARLAEDVEPGNDQIEHRIFVAEAKRLRVLLVEGYPRYDFRYVKALFERESDEVRGNKSIDIDAYLLSAHPDHPKQDRTSINRFPTAEELRKYDVVIFGDVDPKDLPKREAVFDALVKYVKDHGGGLLLLAGSQAMPHAYRETPLADILPVVCDGPPPAPAVDAIKESYRPRLTAAGQSHPLFRFSTEDAENVDIWNRLPPLYWYARGYRRKLSAEVLAVHPERPAEAQAGATAREENHPLILQQFVGSGRVMFLGFDDTWRWRLREDEVRFNQFWIQAVRALARGRISRTEIRTDRKTYRRDNPVRVTVRFPDEAPPPEGPVKVTVERKPARGAVAETQTIQLALREGTRATFEALVTRTPEGDYSFTLSTPIQPGSPPRAEARILPPPGEMDRIQLNEEELQRSARESHGAYYPLHRADKVPEELPSGPRVALDQPAPPLSIWNHPLMFALVLSLLTAEWLMRKKWRLL